MVFRLFAHCIRQQFAMTSGIRCRLIFYLVARSSQRLAIAHIGRRCCIASRPCIVKGNRFERLDGFHDQCCTAEEELMFTVRLTTSLIFTTRTQIRDVQLRMINSHSHEPAVRNKASTSPTNDRNRGKSHEDELGQGMATPCDRTIEDDLRRLSLHEPASLTGCCPSTTEAT